jgi:starch-binding outer membrane protein, SusD/RagB family
MKNRKFYKNIPVIFILAIIITMSSCNYLNIDRYIYDVTTMDSIFQHENTARKYLNGAAAYLPRESQMYTVSGICKPFGFVSDECFPSWNDDRHYGSSYLRGDVTAFVQDEYDNYGTYYEGIRKANTFLANIDKCTDITEITKRDYVGLAHFLRGYYYFHLLLQYGPVPIVPNTPIATNASITDMSVARSTYDVCVNYIIAEMDTAANLLKSERPSSDLHLPTQGAALAVISRLTLYAASPWFNGNTFYSDWKTTEGENYINQTNDNSKWGRAAAAAKRVIDLGTYSLYTAPRDAETDSLLNEPADYPRNDWPNGAGDIDAYHSYADIFDGGIAASNDPELIWSETMDETDADNGANSVAWICTPVQMLGGDGMNVTQNLVDAYKMRDGLDPANSPLYPSADQAYKPIGTVKEVDGADGVQLNSTVAKMYDNREYRFYATIAFCESYWSGSSYTGTTANAKNFTATYYADGSCKASDAHPNDYNHTGYSMKKYIHPEDNFRGTVRSKEFPIFRYAEILLNYVEAMNEMDGTYTDPITNTTVSRNVDEIVKDFNMIRFRCGLPGITAADAEDRDNMRSLIKREREVEFACEGLRFYDLVRWGDAMKTLNASVRGMNISAKSTQRQLFYTPIVLTDQILEKRQFMYKMTFWPIKENYLYRNSKLTQNPGW